MFAFFRNNLLFVIKDEYFQNIMSCSIFSYVIYSLDNTNWIGSEEALAATST